MNGKDMEGLIKHVVYKVYKIYPQVEWEDLEAQAWLIVTEQIEKYDKDRGASLSTYLYSVLEGHLKMYVQRYVLKEENLNGHRDHGEMPEVSIRTHEHQVDARMDMERIIKEQPNDVSRDVMTLMFQGYTQKEIVGILGICKQYVSKIVMRVRGEQHETW
jgi:RNA polymerase sigma factor (sigma-70 family)